MIHVTDVLSMLQDFSGVPVNRLEEARQLGTEVHRYALAWIANRDLTLDSGDSVVNRYVEKVKEWYEANVIDVYCVEKRFQWGNFNLTGRVDLIARIRGDRYWSLIDLKRVASVSRFITGMQTAAYREGARICWRKVPTRRFALHVPKDGPCKAVEFKNHDHDWAMFQQALNLYLGAIASGHIKPPAERAA